MKLGVRYIGVDRDGEQSKLHEAADDARQFAYTDHNVANYDTSTGVVYAIDLDNHTLVPFDCDETEFHERNWIHHYTALQAVRPDANPEDAVARELVRLRRQVAAMVSVVEAAIEWMRGPLGNDKHDVPLMIAVDAYRAAQPAEPTRDERQPTPATLTTAEREALDELQRCLTDEQVTGWNFGNWTPGFRGRVVDALRKLRADGGAR